ncbi:MAG: hypothetical protein M0R33_15490 [Methylomonas sp.]|jgi:hypothetical protein|uniref:hypothetical protein n=1 Tax=Methylomonas sp. TaxID=418 RepID=UPI0025FAB90B|nr:hypothetical protein [Methylomonas sp.]MCK9607846.1 hypothetical protein [Methylomonas sp.]
MQSLDDIPTQDLIKAKTDCGEYAVWIKNIYEDYQRRLNAYNAEQMLINEWKMREADRLERLNKSRYAGDYKIWAQNFPAGPIDCSILDDSIWAWWLWGEPDKEWRVKCTTCGFGSKCGEIAVNPSVCQTYQWKTDPYFLVQAQIDNERKADPEPKQTIPKPELITPPSMNCQICVQETITQDIIAAGKVNTTSSSVMECTQNIDNAIAKRNAENTVDPPVDTGNEDSGSMPSYLDPPPPSQNRGRTPTDPTPIPQIIDPSPSTSPDDAINADADADAASAKRKKIAIFAIIFILVIIVIITAAILLWRNSGGNSPKTA